MVPVQVNGLIAVIKPLSMGLDTSNGGRLHPLVQRGVAGVGVRGGLGGGGAEGLAVGHQLAAQLVHLVEHRLHLGA